MRRPLVLVVVALVALALAVVLVLVLTARHHDRSAAQRAAVLASLCAGTNIKPSDAQKAMMGAPLPYPRLRELARDGRVIIVRGTVADARPGRAFLPNGQQGPFDSERAVWREAHLKVHVDEIISGRPARRDRDIVVVPIALSGGPVAPVNQTLKGLKGLEAVWFLNHSMLIDGALLGPNVYPPVFRNKLIAPIDAAGRLRLPCPASEYPADILAGAETVAALRAAVHAPGPVTYTVQQSDDEVRRYWTPERMAAAQGA